MGNLVWIASKGLLSPPHTHPGGSTVDQHMDSGAQGLHVVQFCHFLTLGKVT